MLVDIKKRLPDKNCHATKMSSSCRNFLSRILNKKRQDRLGGEGNTGAQFILKHPWFKDIDVEGIRNRTFKSPYVFEDDGDEDDLKFFEEDEGEEKEEHDTYLDPKIRANTAVFNNTGAFTIQGSPRPNTEVKKEVHDSELSCEDEKDKED